MAGLLAVAVLAAGCSSGGSDDDAASSTTTTAPGTEAPTTTGPLGSGTSPIADGIRIEVLSSQPDRITGDDARIRVTPAPGGRTEDLQVLVDERDVTGSLVAADGALEGVIDGLIEGNSTLTARAGDDEAIQRLRAWPRTGPVFSGPHPAVLACSVAALEIGTPTDADCSAATSTTWRYVRDDGAVAPLASPTSRPDDLATGDVDGREVPLVIRVERGVINRAPYELAWLDDDATDETSPSGWNERLLLRFSGSCETTFGQGRTLATAADATYLREGYAVATSTFLDASTQCNDVLAAETATMIKERAIEALGRPRHTIGEGSRGGAALLHLLAQNYPGVVNGVVASQPMPDLLTPLSVAHDCLLLERYFSSAAGGRLQPAQRTAITGFEAADACTAWTEQLGGTLVPTDGCDPDVPSAQRYDPAGNRTGVRCTYQDANRNQIGTDPATGWAFRPIDNVGLQYGLAAFNEGDLSFEQFVELNRAIGGLDPDGTPTEERTAAPFDGVARSFEAGRVSFAGGDQLNIPIIDIDLVDDEPTPYDRLRTFGLRDRLTRGGTPEDAPGFQIWTRHADDPRSLEAPAEAVALIDEWLLALADHDEGGTLAQALRQTRPDDAVDNCLAADDDEPTRGTDVHTDDGACLEAEPIGGDPRTVAGAPRSGHVLKCELRPIDRLDYAEDLTTAQLNELAEVFPTGVCDWFVPSVGQTTPAAPDRSYEDVTTPEQSV
jgi:hypothetical protein